MMNRFTFLFLILLFMQQACYSQKKAVGYTKRSQSELYSKISPAIKVTPVNIYKPYPPSKRKDEKIFVSAYETDIKHGEIAVIEILSDFNVDRKKIIQLLINEAKKIGADGIIKIHYSTGRKVISDFLPINKRLSLPVKIYETMMVTSAVAIVFSDYN